MRAVDLLEWNAPGQWHSVASRVVIKKDAAVEELILAVEMVAAGRHYIDPTLAAALLERRDVAKPILSSREVQVIELVVAKQGLLPVALGIAAAFLPGTPIK